ncbi:hypothetical protein B566_EDAN007379 [Ephemera danica]|nr:hypothetical protein B566_EDAN007379 [Ephemera danica]
MAGITSSTAAKHFGPRNKNKYFTLKLNIMDTEYDQIGDQYDDDLEEIIERQGDEMEAEQEDEEDDRRGNGEDEAVEAPAPKKKDAKATDETKKKRPPQPKLDPERLNGPRGLLTLEAEMRTLKLRGRGHELEDLDLVLGRLQHWAHRLFPSYTFDDCLEKLEKLGSKKTVNVQLKKIRMGMTSVDDIHDTTLRGEDYMDEDAPAPRLRDLDAEFDNVRDTARPVATQPAAAPVPPDSQPVSTGLTDEQKERIMRNRLAAEERRLARLKEQREQELRAQEEAAALEAVEDFE